MHVSEKEWFQINHVWKFSNLHSLSIFKFSFLNFLLFSLGSLTCFQLILVGKKLTRSFWMFWIPRSFYLGMIYGTLFPFPAEIWNFPLSLLWRFGSDVWQSRIPSFQFTSWPGWGRTCNIFSDFKKCKHFKNLIIFKMMRLKPRTAWSSLMISTLRESF